MLKKISSNVLITGVNASWNMAAAVGANGDTATCDHHAVYFHGVVVKYITLIKLAVEPNIKYVAREDIL